MYINVIPIGKIAQCKIDILELILPKPQYMRPLQTVNEIPNPKKNQAQIY